ncbi:MAG: signal peptidase II [Alphaproteobacteria bacterium]|nr:signal peptidase II [Alphaproteobacteria bacterium]|tara:strand:+ start:396 stop:872 length:477 start_codon:yes stop_codon:yes gene_type:complete
MFLFGLFIVLITILIDQITKLIAISYLWEPTTTLNLFSFLSFTPVENRGISFGFFQESGDIGRWLISFFAITVSIVLIFWLRKQRYKFSSFYIGLVIGGALGNVIDRLRQGWVIDFIDFYVGSWHWPAFNLADAFITSGLFLLFIHNLLRPQKQNKYK